MLSNSFLTLFIAKIGFFSHITDNFADFKGSKRKKQFLFDKKWEIFPKGCFVHRGML